MTRVGAIEAAVCVIPSRLSRFNCRMTVIVKSQSNPVPVRRWILAVQLIAPVDFIVAVDLRIFVHIIFGHNSFHSELNL